jgi:shikimate dehydrogenase
MSAVMHNAAFRELELDLKYELRSVEPSELGKFVKSFLRKTEVGGANVTIPHKESILEYLDEVDFEASRIGAVNTIKNEGGLLKGYNTDCNGAIRVLEESYGDLSKVKAVMFGAGGAAMAIGYGLSTRVKTLHIFNRTLIRGRRLALELSKLPECKAQVSASPLNEDNLGKVKDADIMINATSLGMGSNLQETPVEAKHITPRTFVFDSVYNPPKTKLLKQAEEIGARTISGVKMLLYQGAASFKIWTQKNPPEEVMLKAIMDSLGCVMN